MPSPRSHVVLRDPLPTDRAQVLAAQAELAADDFNFALFDFGPGHEDPRHQDPGYRDQVWEQFLDKVARDRSGIDLAPGRVPATMLLALVGDDVVGRVHLRHELTAALLEEGGHIGYGVRPGFRRRGYATQMLRQGLVVAQHLGIARALVTCDDDNPGSIATIERCGGQLEDRRRREDGRLTRRYWIDLA
ncbi:GNAT family N-acetyltransferase [Ornithinimicrobium cryptoxanthini]|uniref:GNAT family N-acetyltransferase n=1 Tax=Ornithinimicrobium cryptoxanthini TaxID=2934161 RepID=A0ABY4YJG4_9MICO|nr:GNAT family N-acetyltransferase [Ornithinimicrobium cryptoxanthini]USQ76933.1 GNAT family N-acetyltransferase [Ornithinimicrobium cryptoxanthini]